MQGNKGDIIFHLLSLLAAFLILAVLAGIIFELFRLSLPAMAKFGPTFLVSTKWNPVSGEFGAASSIFGTLVSTLIALLLAVPLSLIIALFLVELAPPLVSRIAGAGIELLAAIPSIIYGMWGLFVFVPLMAKYVQPLLGRYLEFLPLFRGPAMGVGTLTAGIILALMILPYISAVMRDVFAMTPAVMKEAAYGLGATTWEVTSQITLRYGSGGLIGATFLGLGRALGETMAVTFVIGNSRHISVSLFSPSNTIASTLANEFTEAVDPIYRSSLVFLAFVLLLLTLGIQIAAQLWLRRLKKKLGVNA